MKSKIISPKQGKKEFHFPKLMIGNEGCVILATGQCGNSITGTRVNNGTAFPIGEYSDRWRAKVFSDFDGKVELSND